MTLLCVPILVLDDKSAIADTVAAKVAGAEIVELRVDRLFTGAFEGDEAGVILRIVAASPLPCIVTCRTKGPEGGHYDGPESKRVFLFKRLASSLSGASFEHPPRYIDVELDAYAPTSPRSRETGALPLREQISTIFDDPERENALVTSLILSSHDFDGRPRDLLRRIARMREEPAARVVKVAFKARSIRDNLELFDVLDENAAGKPMIALAMGRFGLMSRVLAPKFGGFLTFASLRPEAATAPGQPTVAELLRLYRFRSITPRTAVYGVVGWPLEHTLSPAVHNAGFGAAGIDAVYLPLPVPPEYEHFKASVGALIDHARLDFGGCSVTIPHKESLLRFAIEEQGRARVEWSIGPTALACGAANTLVLNRGQSGTVTSATVLNTDAPAIAACLTGMVGDLAGKRVAIIGAGGVARGAACAALLAGAHITVFNRAPERAERLEAGLLAGLEGLPDASVSQRLQTGSMDDLAESGHDVYINCTPVGMTGGPAPESSPVPDRVLARRGPGAVVMDTVYAPRMTPLLIAAERAGCRVIDGLAIFVRQAEAQFAAWTGSPPPPGLFERIAGGDSFGHNTGE